MPVLDPHIGAAAGATGGPALTADMTSTFLRKDGTYQNPFSSQPAVAPAGSPAAGVSTYSGVGGSSLAGGGGVDASENGQGLIMNGAGTVPGSILTAASTLATFTAEAQLAGLSIPANDPVAGAIYYMRLSGVYGCTGTPTFAFGLRYGGAAGTSIAAVPAITMAGTLTSAPFDLEAILQFYSAVLAVGVIRLHLDSSASTDLAASYMASPTGGVAVVSSSAKVMSVTVTCGTSNAANTVSALVGYGMRLA
jgi:hypothetical protein